MLIAGIDWKSAPRFRRVYGELNDQLGKTLDEINDALTALNLVDTKGRSVTELSLKVWLLPPWYAVALQYEGSLRIAAADLTIPISGRPTMVCAAQRQGANWRGTGRTWSIGKGLIGQAVLEPTSIELGGDEAFHTVLRNEEMKRLAGLKPREFRRAYVKGETRGRSRKDIRRLNACLGTSIAAPLRTPETSFAFGCITMDSDAYVELTDESRKNAGLTLSLAVPAVVGAISEWGRYSFPISARS